MGIGAAPTSRNPIAAAAEPSNASNATGRRPMRSDSAPAGIWITSPATFAATANRPTVAALCPRLWR